MKLRVESPQHESVVGSRDLDFEIGILELRVWNWDLVGNRESGLGGWNWELGVGSRESGVRSWEL